MSTDQKKELLEEVMLHGLSYETLQAIRLMEKHNLKNPELLTVIKSLIEITYYTQVKRVILSMKNSLTSKEIQTIEPDKFILEIDDKIETSLLLVKKSLPIEITFF